ncbi:hypothetical protein [Teredinibacter turnerae]|uniref:hypothetical protein n=1 Tax=Teredinibacter turnerae TaxID=2426 RepID=UPI00048C7A84|nr:hypothetical protein [Teredinibacter turnerae]
MKAYGIIYTVLSVILTILLAWMMVTGILNLNIIQTIVALLITIILWAGAISAGKNTQYKLILSVIVNAILCILFLYRLITRILFVQKYGEMEDPDGYGSPLAFLIGLAIELSFFIPLFVLFIYGVILTIMEKSKNA